MNLAPIRTGYGRILDGLSVGLLLFTNLSIDGGARYILWSAPFFERCYNILRPVSKGPLVAQNLCKLKKKCVASMLTPPRLSCTIGQPCVFLGTKTD